MEAIGPCAGVRRKRVLHHIGNRKTAGAENYRPIKEFPRLPVVGILSPSLVEDDQNIRVTPVRDVAAHGQQPMNIHALEVG